MVVENLSFDIAPGELVALVGPSGAGKTSITYLALRFYGTDIRQCETRRARSAGYSAVLAAEVHEHSPAGERRIPYHCQGQPSNRQARRDGLGVGGSVRSRTASFVGGKFTGRLPDCRGRDGIQVVGRRETAACYRPAPCSSGLGYSSWTNPRPSLDSITERAIRDAMASVRSGGPRPTTIVIAHRLSTILSADKILVLDEGRCIDSGTHKECWHDATCT